MFFWHVARLSVSDTHANHVLQCHSDLSLEKLQENILQNTSEMSGWITLPDWLSQGLTRHLTQTDVISEMLTVNHLAWNWRK